MVTPVTFFLNIPYPGYLSRDFFWPKAQGAGILFMHVIEGVGKKLSGVK